MALGLFDYFYTDRSPAPGDEKPWRAIEGATHRIVESEQFLGAAVPMDEQIRHARRLRRAVNTVMRKLECLSTPPQTWMIEALAQFAALADHWIDTYGATADAIVMN
ncbi:MAG TPA: hypothetical protein VFQ53_41600 [Kofleriaceae bacterium]|nr:hypothetical protein [Kofleriaceae bacterium]